MTVLYIQSWDIDSKTLNANLPGLADYAPYYYVPPLNQLEYQAGYLTGQAIRDALIPQFGFVGSAGTNGNLLPIGQGVLRASWFAKKVPNGNFIGDIWYGFLMFYFDSNLIGVQLNKDGQFRLARGGFYPGNPIFAPTDTTIEVISSASSATLGSTFGFCELYINLPSNRLEFRFNGVLVCQGSLATPLSNPVGRPSPAFNHPNNFDTILDHLVITDGESLVGQHRIHAIAPTPSFSGGGTLRGNLIIGGQSYQTARQAVSIGYNSYGCDNASNTFYFLYSKDPATGLDWGTSLSQVEGWGVCSGDIREGLTLHMPSLGLSIVDTMTDPSGYPIIRTVAPTGLTYFSGPWTKSDPSLSLAGHLTDIPRTVLFANDKYIEIQSDGCVLFGIPGAERLLTDLGITFAEEFRTDYVDWYRVLYGGIPFESYFITGYTILGEGNKQFQSNYVTVNYQNVAVGGAYLQGVWDYALSGDTGRWGTRQQIYRMPSGNYKHQMAKLKVRGHGRSLQIKITSEQNKDFKLNGWTTAASGNSTV